MTTLKQVTSQLRRKLYMAVGAIQGQYQPSVDIFTQGILLANDGTKFPAILHDKLEQQLKQQPELLNTQQFFGVWPSTSADKPELFLKLKSIRKEDQQQPGLLEADVDQFSICGVVVSQDKEAGKIVIQIKRNGKTPVGKEQDPEWQPFNLEIFGKLPDDAVEQFWQLSCHRNGERLVMTDASLFVKAPRPESLPKADETLAPPTRKAATPAVETSIAPDSPLASSNAATTPTPGKLEVVVKMNQFPNDVRTVDSGWKEFSVDTGSRIVTITAKPKAFAALEQAQQTYPDWVAAISGQMGSATGAGFRLESPAIKVFERKPSISFQQQQTTHSKSSLIGPTPSKLELTIKINEFPAIVRTFDNGWKQFDVDAGDRVVTITVKPKVFKKLEIAQENYPMWVAAIAGQMGEMTDRGFMLLESNIQVFERKPKNSATTELPQNKDNSEPSPATESQQQPAFQPKTEFQPQASPVAKPQTPPAFHPMQRPKERLKQQRLSIAPKNLGQNQQCDQASPSQKQPTTSAPNSKPQSEPPRFTVKVNDQIFQGHDSVTLNKRVVRVDGVTVGQAKMVIVLGAPRTVQADGGVTQGRNQAVLMSR